MQQFEHGDTSAELRRLSLMLIIGIYSLPVIFAWFLLRPGYSSHVRLGGFLSDGRIADRRSRPAGGVILLPTSYGHSYR
jgi:hypothetical protein